MSTVTYNKSFILEALLEFKTKDELDQFKAAIQRHREENNTYLSGRAVIEMVTQYYDRVEPLDTNLFSDKKNKEV